MSGRFGDTPGIFPDDCSLAVDLWGAFGALLGIAEGAGIVYAASVGNASMILRVIFGVLGVVWATTFALLIVAWSKGWFE